MKAKSMIGYALLLCLVAACGKEDPASLIGPDGSPYIKFKDPVLKECLLTEMQVDWNGRLYDVKADSNGNGEITEREAECVEVLYLSLAQYYMRKDKDKEISCYDELAYFKNLRYLNLSCDNVEALDFSSFNALEQLLCSGDLTSLDVSQNAALTYLDCSYCCLTSLDVSRNPELRTLYCFGNMLTTLDLSNNRRLGYLSCHDNRLTSLDVSHCPLISILWCQNNLENPQRVDPVCQAPLTLTAI